VGDKPNCITKIGVPAQEDLHFLLGSAFSANNSKWRFVYQADINYILSDKYIVESSAMICNKGTLSSWLIVTQQIFSQM